MGRGEGEEGEEGKEETEEAGGVPRTLNHRPEILLLGATPATPEIRPSRVRDSSCGSLIPGSAKLPGRFRAPKLTGFRV